jgi:hypothetical protein
MGQDAQRCRMQHGQAGCLMRADAEQQVVDDPFVVPGDRTDGGGQREDDVEVFDG